MSLLQSQWLSQTCFFFFFFFLSFNRLNWHSPWYSVCPIGNLFIPLLKNWNSLLYFLSQLWPNWISKCPSQGGKDNSRPLLLLNHHPVSFLLICLCSHFSSPPPSCLYLPLPISDLIPLAPAYSQSLCSDHAVFGTSPLGTQRIYIKYKSNPVKIN